MKPSLFETRLKRPLHSAEFMIKNLHENLMHLRLRTSHCVTVQLLKRKFFRCIYRSRSPGTKNLLKNNYMKVELKKSIPFSLPFSLMASFDAEP